jgi:hypothetical protein
MTFHEELKRDISKRVVNLELMVEANNGLHDYLIEQKRAELYEREQVMDAVTDYE